MHYELKKLLRLTNFEWANIGVSAIVIDTVLNLKTSSLPVVGFPIKSRRVLIIVYIEFG